MPGYKTHMAGALGLVGGVIAVTFWFGIYRPDLETILGMGVMALLGGLFPDVDTNSKGRRWFYTAALLVDLYWLVQKEFKHAAILGFVALLPAIDGHRGWTHTWWAALLVPSAVVLCPMVLLHHPWQPLVPFYLAGVLGYFSHLALDGTM